METRRDLLLARALLGSPEQAICTSGAARDRNQFPDIMVTDQDGTRWRFYEDLIRGRVVAINFMAIDREADFPITSRMAAIATRLGGRLGSSVFLYSLTADPDADTPERLKDFAARFGAPPGWRFLTTSTGDAGKLALRLYRHGRTPSAGSMIDLVHYGNAEAGLWAAFPATIQADDAASRIGWVLPRAMPDGPPRQAGPRRLGSPGDSANNRI
jgi:protein SCO1/2